LVAATAIAFAGYYVFNTRPVHNAADEGERPNARLIVKQPHPVAQQPQQVPIREMPNPKRHLGDR